MELIDDWWTRTYKHSFIKTHEHIFNKFDYLPQKNEPRLTQPPRALETHMYRPLLHTPSIAYDRDRTKPVST